MNSRWSIIGDLCAPRAGAVRGDADWYSLQVLRDIRRVLRLCWGALLCASGTLAAAQEMPASPSPDAASPRPRIGLVLSGGGARGMAHIGVLKVLEDLRVPVDAIAGTSMGAIVGGLYASGLTAHEIENIMQSVDWRDAFRDTPPREDLSFRRKQEDRNFLVRFPLGLRGRKFLLPRGLIQGQKLSQALRRLTLPVDTVSDFDALATPFRALATDLETGEPVVLGRGDLADAMRASMSAPGVFTPVDYDGRVLVDGGLSANLPVETARSMGVDLLIVVDVGQHLLPRTKLNSVGVISNQMLAILIRRESQRQRELLGPADIVIDPALGDLSSFDFGAEERAISLGQQAARELGPRLGALAISATQYARYVAQRAALRAAPPPRIDYVRVAAGARRYGELLDEAFGEFAGRPLEPAALERRISEFYGQGNVEDLDYRLEHEDGRYGLVLSARRNTWGPNYIRFGLNLQDDFEGNAAYNAAARILLSELTSRGGEWSWDFQIGESPRIASELYLPLTYLPRWFVAPSIDFRVRNTPLIRGEERIAEYRTRSIAYGLDLGRELSNWGEVRTGLRYESGHSRVRLGDPALPVDRFDAGSYFVRLSIDRLDNVNFPRQGESLTVEWRGESTGLGSDASADLATVDWLLAHSWGRNTGVLWSSFGTRFNDDVREVRTLYPLGGFLNLSGIAPASIAGPHFGIVRALYYRKLSRGEASILNVPTYAGMSLETGDVWERRRDASFGHARRSASLFLGLDTLVGPVYLGTGFDFAGKTAYYLFLGRTF
ncbi:MAG: patatin-like phospholipase family protein [Gammaproteobacteria bacterium]|nr:patatin-like phospholipase family protein [Gammaproteobacteria bacterium]